MKEEVWKVYNNFIDRQFSNLGRYKIDNYIKNIKPNCSGYQTICVNGKRYPLHRIIADLFCDGKSIEKKIVDHINGIRDDNRSENLRWVTSSENNKNRRKDGRFKKEHFNLDNKQNSDEKMQIIFLLKQVERLQEECKRWSDYYFKKQEQLHTIQKMI